MNTTTRAQIVDRFTPVVGAVGPGWVDGETLLTGAGTDALDAMIAARRRTGVTDAAAGSLVVLEYSRLLAWPVLAVALRDGARLDHEPRDVAIRPGELAPGRLVFHRAPVPRAGGRGDDPVDPDGVVETVDALVERHLARVVESVRLRVRVGRRTLWSNVAAAVAGGLLALSWDGIPRDRHLDLARTVLDTQPRLRGLAVPLAVSHDGSDWMVVWRRGCCLAFRRGDGAAGYCGTCPVLDEPERLARFHRAAARYVELVAPPRPAP